ncbi:gastrula zinc finger protein XlCGF46.1-like [Drosophila albomicans]|uniref:Gastrula zinc finger protein XlCGF46.1-like n=1 Tax=Drosophila albomicans TaxID=7291 RepID=A0A6P8X938_DROAB|nr:gastrula zinc finger protein XlCGF46.1-like [Drosophila albomicans]
MAAFTKCRVCTCALDATVGSYDMLHLPMLAQKFTACTNLCVAEDDSDQVPSELCQTCYDQLEQLYDFRAKCIAADTNWRMQQVALVLDDGEVDGYEVLEVSAGSSQVDDISSISKESNCDMDEIIEQQIETLEAEPDDEEATEEEQLVTNIFKCDSCAAQFLDEQRLLTHKRRHGQMPYPCPEPGCDRGYSHKHTLTLHMRKCHQLGKEHKSHICEFCGKVFDTMSQLRNHRFTHKEKSELPYACEEPNCDRRFSSKQLLKVHMMRHAGIKNYTCSFCGVQKTTRTELKIHLNYHTLERTYSCRFCSKVCYSSSNLNKHMRTVHERARNYACSYCDSTFTQQAICKQHELIHTGEKPHQCGECGRCFRQKAALRTHYKIHRRKLKEMNMTTISIESAADDEYCEVIGEEIVIDKAM